MVKRTDGVKSRQGCEGITGTVGALRAVAAWRLAARTVANLVPVGSNCFLGVSCALLSHRTSESIDPKRTTAGTDICVVRGASGAHARGASGGRSVWRLQPTSPWTQVPPMHFLSLTEYNVGV
eukprot:5473422-Prymnesium_polylepis.2